MRKFLALALIGVLVLLATSASAPQVQQEKQISCVMDIAVVCTADWSDCWWEGPVTGCMLAGMVEFRENPATFPGKTQHFSEDFKFAPTAGGWIKGVDDGVWNFSTFKFRANGWVTQTSPEWAGLVGAKFHEMGTTTDPNGWPILGTGTTMTLH